MNKNEFIMDVKGRLNTYPETEIDKALSFYVESIEDRVEDGMSEEDAVASLGNMEDIIKNVQSEMPINVIVKNKIESKKSQGKMNTSTIILIVVLALLSMPIWLPAIIGVVAFIIGIVAVVFALGVAAIAVVFGLCVAGVTVVGYALFNSITVPAGLVLMLLGMMCIGVGLLIPIVRLVIILFKKLIDGIKWCFKKIKLALV